MNVHEILKLLDAGYSKEDIESLASEESAEEVNASGTETAGTDENKGEEPQQNSEPKEDTVTLSLADYNKLIQTKNMQSAQKEVPKSRTIKDALSDHYKSILGGDKNE